MTSKIIGAVLVLLTANHAYAQTVKVLKVSGRKAIVQTAPGTELKVGQTLNVEDDALGEGSDKSSFPPSNGKRANSAGFSGDLSAVNAGHTNGTASLTTTIFDLNAFYGWNKVTMEFGPRLGLSSVSAGGSNTSQYTAGGFFDYNFVPNNPGTELVYGAGGTVDLGTASQSSGSGSVMNFFAGGNLKWFPLGISVAVRGDAGLVYYKTSTSGDTITQTGFMIKGGFQVYF